MHKKPMVMRVFRHLEPGVALSRCLLVTESCRVLYHPLHLLGLHAPRQSKDKDFSLFKHTCIHTLDVR